MYFRDPDVDGLIIVATSEEYADFAFMMLTRDELASGDRKCHVIILGLPERSLTRLPYGKFSGITKGLTTAEGVPALKLTFLVTRIPREEHLQDNDELLAIGKLEL